MIDMTMDNLKKDTEEIITKLKVRRSELLSSQEDLRVMIAKNTSTIREIDATLIEAEGLLKELG